MENKVFLDQQKHFYESLKYFDIQNNFLILKAEKNYLCTLEHIRLAELNHNIFLLHPKEIFRIIYALELLYKMELTESDIEFITDYTKRYLELETLFKNGEFTDTDRLWNFSLPIYYAENEQLSLFPASEIIKNIINEQNTFDESSLEKGPKLVLVKGGNPNFEIDENNELNVFEKTGFTTIFLIVTSITITAFLVLYFAFGT